MNRVRRARSGLDQLLGIWVLWCAEDLRDASGLDDHPLLEDHYPISERLGGDEVMGDQEEAEVSIFNQAPQEGEKLFSQGDIEHGGRLISDEDFRFTRERSSDTDSLALSSGQSVGVTVNKVTGRGEPNTLQELERSSS